MWAVPAYGHTLLQSSEPPNGATVKTSPPHVNLVFSEEPDQKLSSIRVLDGSGTQVQRGNAAAVAGRPSAMSVALGPLPKGVYTVSWRVLSSVDGHLTSGAFTFGVGVKAVPAPGEAQSPQASPAGVAGRLLFYLGTTGLLGLALVSLWVMPGPLPHRWVMGLAACAVAGAGALAAGQLADSSAGPAAFLSSSLGRGAVLRGLPLVAAAVAAFTLRRRGGLFCAAAALSAMAVHAALGHAAAGEGSAVKVAVQVVHMAAVGIWIGGLFALLLAVRGSPGTDKAAAAGRFSRLAGFALAAVVATGTARAYSEVGSWSKLTTSGYGRLVVAKVALLALLAVLGAANRYRGVPRTADSLAPLRKIGTVEIAVAVLVLGAAAALASTVPAANLAQDPEPLVATAADFGTTFKVRLEADPGIAGSNRFAVSLRDFDSKQPVTATRVNLRFDFVGDPAVGESLLVLSKSGEGRFSGRGSQMSLEGRWRITALVEAGTGSTEVPLEVSTAVRGQSVSVDQAGDQPAIHSLRRPGGETVQIYLDPQRPGQSELHATFFDAGGTETQIQEAVVVAARGNLRSRSLSLRRFGPGHFVADIRLAGGRWTFDIVGKQQTGSLRYLADIEVKR